MEYKEAQQYTIKKLTNKLYDYIEDPTNHHENCNFRKDHLIPANCCSCDMFNIIQEFLLAIKFEYLKK